MSNKKPFFLRISLEEKISFTRNLALLLRSGISLVEALNILKNNTKSKSLSYILSQIIPDIENGHFLSKSLEEYKNVFGNFFISIIMIGELTGNLPENLEKLSAELKKIGSLKRKIITIMIYPAFIISIMVIMIIFTLYFAFPKLTPIFENLGVELPLITRVFLKISNFIINYGHYLFLGFLLLISILIFSLRYKAVKFTIDCIFLYTPLLSTVIKKYVLTEFARIFSLLLKSGIKIVEAIEISSQTLGNAVYQIILEKAVQFVLAGHSLSEFFYKYPNIFFYNFIKMIEIGEKTGNLDKNLNFLAENLEEDINTFLERFINILEPIILIIIAVMIGFMAISILLPIYELSEKLQP